MTATVSLETFSKYCMWSNEAGNKPHNVESQIKLKKGTQYSVNNVMNKHRI